MTVYVKQSNLRQQRPVVYNVLNIAKPAECDGPTLLSAREVITLFHEFGHALHGMLSNVTYPSIAGTSVCRDFLEFPSQINEKWATHDPVLRNYTLHYKTAEPMPE
uniref:Peptidyl-dipeptidase dcp n=1 Tax=Lygus hesperus TaxID=30085 RepID=A0A0A9YJK9_LYGHE